VIVIQEGKPLSFLSLIYTSSFFHTHFSHVLVFGRSVRNAASVWTSGGRWLMMGNGLT
jgi:hypothetical protein